MARLKCSNCGKHVSDYEFPRWLANEPWFSYVECGRCGRESASEKLRSTRAVETIEGVLGMLLDPERWALVLSGRTVEGASDVTMAVVQDLVYAAKTLRGQGNGEYRPKFAEHAKVGQDVAGRARAPLPLSDFLVRDLAREGGDS
jgi:hypothetical protein